MYPCEIRPECEVVECDICGEKVKKADIAYHEGNFNVCRNCDKETLVFVSQLERVYVPQI